MLSLALLVGVGASQDAKKDKDNKKVKGILPAGFKDLGLSKAQIEKVYTIQGDFRGKIAELQTKINELKKIETKEVFSVLTDEQREKYLKAKGVETKDKAPAKDKAPPKDKTADKDKK